jgi:cytochrome c oxidase cbb3-type subunit 1
MYYVIPRLSGRELYSKKLALWHFWLTVAGFSLMASVLTLQGLLQGTMLDTGADFVDSMVAMKPYWFTRTLAGVTMDIGAICGFWNLFRTASEGKPIEATGRSVAMPYPEPQLT